MLKQITHEEAVQKRYVQLHKNFLYKDVSKTSFFTLTPHPDPELREKGVEKVTYYFDKKKLIKPPRRSANF